MLNYQKIFFFKILLFWNFKFFTKLIKTKYLTYTFSFWFTKKKNLNKLYVFNKNFFLSPGMVLYFNLVKAKFYKNKLKLWTNYVMLYKSFFKTPTIVVFNKFFFNKKYCFTLMIKNKLLVDFFIFSLPLLYTVYPFLKKKSSIKKWLTKRYAKFLIN